MANTTVAPLRMEIRFRNNIILKMMENLEIKTVAELCRQAKLSQSQVGNIINMKELPLKEDSSWLPVVVRLSEFFNCLPEDMFSEEQLELKLAKNRSFAELTFSQIQTPYLTNEEESSRPDKIFERLQLTRLITEMLSCLPPLHEKIIRLRFGIGTKDDGLFLEEIAKITNLTMERVRQIEADACRKLRHPCRSNYLKQFLEGQ